MRPTLLLRSLLRPSLIRAAPPAASSAAATSRTIPHTVARRKSPTFFAMAASLENGVKPMELAAEQTKAANPRAKRPRPQQNGPHSKKRQRSKRERNITEGSSEEVLQADVDALIASRTAEVPKPEESSVSTPTPLPDLGSEFEVEVLVLSSTGDGLAVRKQDSTEQHVYVVPFVAPGDTARVRVFKHFPNEHYSLTDFITVTSPSPMRDDSRIKCQYFSRCAGCQFQMLDYDDQLRHKRDIVVKAFRNFSQLAPELIPTVGDTIGSPLQYGYRTKLTPHFDGPPGPRHNKSGGPRPGFGSCPDVGFMVKGRRKVLDIEDCPIGTDAVRKGLTRERNRMTTEFSKYTRGATILLRETTQRYPKHDTANPPPETIPDDVVRVETETHVDIKTCVTDNAATTTEYIDSHIFANPAGSFFQNNNSILPIFTSYVREHILPPPDAASNSGPQINHLIDAYSGSGLFTITLSPLFTSSTGIDIADQSITYARRNASLNDLPPTRCSFTAADARELFRNVTFDPNETAVVLDPPRKGCDADFLSQLLNFAPRRVLYVSCNVHTQARDVGVLVRGIGGGEGDGAKRVRYEIESLRGFDFFPQTGHVEGVAVLNRVVDDIKG